MSVQPLQDPLSSLSLSSSSSSPFIPTPDSLPTFDSHSKSKRSKQSKEPSDDPKDFYGNHHRTISVNKGEEDSDTDSNEISQELPSFFPPLWLQRRTFICDALKREGIRSVADLGCGLGSLISLLSIPAYHVDDFPSLYPPSTPPPDSLPSSYLATNSFPSPTSPSSSSSAQSKSSKLSILRSIPTDPSRQELHLRKLIGIDQDLSTCQKLVSEQLSAREEGERVEKSMWMVPEYRWEELEVKVFNGNVENFNECLEDCEALVLTEVVEHMTEQALSKLPNLLFNIYAPRLLIITTPNHLFNPFFPPQASPTSSSTLYSDPTCRTSRVFRDPTHLLEYTPSEFESFCHSLLSDSNCSDEYTLSFTGVGNLASYHSSTIPFPPPSLSSHPSLSTHPILTSPIQNPEQFNATQIAIFTKKFSFESERSPRSARPVPLPFFQSPNTSPQNPSSSLPSLSRPSNSRNDSGLPIPHKLVGSSVLPSHPSRSSPASDQEILVELERMFGNSSRGGRMSLDECWRVGGLPSSEEERKECLRVLCAGEVGRIVEVLLEEEEWTFGVSEEEGREGMERLVIEWIGRRKEVITSEKEGEVGVDEREEEEKRFEEDEIERNGGWETERREASEIQEEMEEREREGVVRIEGNPDQGGWNDEW